VAHAFHAGLRAFRVPVTRRAGNLARFAFVRLVPAAQVARCRSASAHGTRSVEAALAARLGRELAPRAVRAERDPHQLAQFVFHRGQDPAVIGGPLLAAALCAEEHRVIQPDKGASTKTGSSRTALERRRGGADPGGRRPYRVTRTSARRPARMRVAKPGGRSDSPSAGGSSTAAAERQSWGFAYATPLGGVLLTAFFHLFLALLRLFCR
jgi:hypothetical protein